MKMPAASEESATQKREKNFQRRKIVQANYNEEYLQSLINTKEKFAFMTLISYKD